MDTELITAIRQVVREEIAPLKEDISGLKNDVGAFFTSSTSVTGTWQVLKKLTS